MKFSSGVGDIPRRSSRRKKMRQRCQMIRQTGYGMDFVARMVQNVRMFIDLYKGAAWFYARYRPFYPKKEIDDIVNFFSLSKSSRVLDLGSGTGQLAIQLAEYVGGVIAVEPDDDMFSEGKLLCARKGVKNIRWIQSKAEDIESIPNLGVFNVITFGTSFHWIERDRVLKMLNQLVVPNGGIVVTGTSSLWESTGAWEQQVKKIIKAYLGEKRRAGSTTYREALKKDDPHQDTLRHSPFSIVEDDRQYLEHRTRSLDEVVGYVYSMSFSSPALFGDRKNEFEKELRDTLIRSNVSGAFKSEEKFYAIFARRK